MTIADFKTGFTSCVKGQSILDLELIWVKQHIATGL